MPISSAAEALVVKLSGSSTVEALRAIMSDAMASAGPARLWISTHSKTSHLNVRMCAITALTVATDDILTVLALAVLVNVPAALFAQVGLRRAAHAGRVLPAEVSHRNSLCNGFPPSLSI